MIDERELMEWIETHKILSKTDSIGSDGKYYYGIDFVSLRAEIQRLSGTRWIGGDVERTEDSGKTQSDTLSVDET